jgi:hypothetical protein
MNTALWTVQVLWCVFFQGAAYGWQRNLAALEQAIARLG